MHDCGGFVEFMSNVELIECPFMNLIGSRFLGQTNPEIKETKVFPKIQCSERIKSVSGGSI